MEKIFVFMLGAGFENLDNPYPCRYGIKRIRKAYELFCNKSAEAIIVSGELEHKGVKFKHLVKEMISYHDSNAKIITSPEKNSHSFSTDTFGDCKLLSQILFENIDQHCFKTNGKQKFKIFVVTEKIHFFRAKKILKKMLKDLHNIEFQVEFAPSGARVSFGCFFKEVLKNLLTIMGFSNRNSLWFWQWKQKNASPTVKSSGVF